MAEKIDLILLVDDDKDDNQENCETIKKTNLATRVQGFKTAVELLTYFEHCLTEQPNIKYPVPGLVFLDLFMPIYNGFELLDEIRKLPDPHQRKSKIKFVLLTTSLDRVTGRGIYRRAEEDYNDFIITAVQKPLEPALLHEIVEKEF